MGVVAGVVGAVASVAGVFQARKARKEQAKAARLERRRAELSNIRARRRALAESRVLSAQAEAQGINQGVAGSTGVLGSIASLQTQTAANIGFQNQLEALNQQRLSALDRAAGAQFRAQTFSQIGQMVTSFGTGGQSASPFATIGRGLGFGAS